jgi:glycosyltransferase involved in cell wall biosynthesis
MPVTRVSVEPVTVCLVVPNGSHRPDQLAAALHQHHPAWSVVALWCGDPQLHPQRSAGLPWIDIDRVVDGRHVEHMLLAADEHRAEWWLATAAAATLLDRGAGRVVLLWVGAAAVLGPLDALLSVGGPLTVVPRADNHTLDPDRYPDEISLVTDGPFSTTVAAFAAPSPARWLHARLGGTDDLPVGQWLARAARRAGAGECLDPAIGAGPWRWDVDRPALLDVPGFDAEQPWVLDPTVDGPARITLVDHAARRAAVAAALPQVAGTRQGLRLPGCLEVDAVVRGLVRGEMGTGGADDVPLPWSEPAAFRHWLEQHYWVALHASRRDLSSVFAEVRGADEEAFAEWCRGAFAADAVPFLLHAAGPRDDRLEVADTVDRSGVNLVGYLTRDFSLGEVARRLCAAVSAAGMPVAPIAFERSTSPRLLDAPPTTRRIAHATTLAVVNADQFAGLAGDHPELLAATDRMIGYWFWELEHVPRVMRDAFRFVDEVWAGSTFVTDALAAVSPVPVRHVPLPVPEPQPSGRRRASFPVLADLADGDDRFVFLMTFDHLSVTERKNPIGAIEAFRRAFAPDEGPVLVVKSMNGDQRWVQHQAVLAAASERPDVRVWDEHLDRGDQMALVAAADCLVSLHRSEGLGLHLAEAMWLGTPVLATRYSGNLDFMDDDCAVLVDARLAAVVGGQGVYPPAARWADPDLDQAAASMRRLVSDAAWRTGLSRAGRARMEAQPTEAEAGRAIADLLASPVACR